MRNPFAALGARQANGQLPFQSPRVWSGADTGRLNADWNAATLSPDYEVRYQTRIMRARARQLARDNPWISGFVDSVANNIIGPHGIMMQAVVRNAKGGLAIPTNEAIEEAWEEWSFPENASVDRHDSLIELERLIIQTVVVDGECLVRFKESAANPFGFALQIIDVDLLDELWNIPRGEGQNQVRMGVEVDDDNVPVFYHIWSRYAEDMTGTPRVRKRIPASEILHLFVRYRPNQMRGVTWLAPIMNDAKQLSGYQFSALVGARIGAAKMGFIQNTSDAAISGFDPDGPADDQQLFSVEPGMLAELKPGQEFKEFNPNSPSGEYEPFTSMVLRAHARGLKVSNFTLTGDTRQANYSSQRVSLQPERERWVGLQVWFAMHCLRPVFRRWIDSATLRRAVDVDSRLGSNYYAVLWKGRGWQAIDPFNDLKAAKLEMDMGLNSRTRLSADRGRNFETTVEELAYEAQVAEELGVDISGNQITGVNPTTVSNEGKAEEEPGEEPADGSGDGDPAKDNPAQEQQARRTRRLMAIR